MKLFIIIYMQTIMAEDIIRRIRTENSWWEGEHRIRDTPRNMKRRPYFELFYPLIRQPVRRAVVLMGPRRVGKTVMLHHSIQMMLDDDVRPATICYFSVDHPIYNGLRLETLLEYFGQSAGVNYKSEKVYVFFDEIQYLRDWEVHLKSAVDTYPNIKFIASGSSAAALRLKSNESGAGRFTDFLLPPLNFYEYLHLLGNTGLVYQPSGKALESGRTHFVTDKIDELNQLFVSYMNFGGYPELVLSPEMRMDPGRYIKSDIVDKVLLRDLPSLYGIGDIQELNHLFTTLAFNTANEISLGELSQSAGVAKNTIKRYIEYLEAAFLIKVIHRVDHSAKRFHRANFFKIYLTNPSMRAALFSPVKSDDRALGGLTETAVFSQWFHGDITTLHYARWQDGEVDVVRLSEETQKPLWAVEVKWSDRYCDHPAELKSLVSFAGANKLKRPWVTSITRTADREVDGIQLRFVPASLYCYTVGYNATHRKNEKFQH